MAANPETGLPRPVCSGLLDISLRWIFEGSPIPMWVYDVESLRFLEVNEAAVRCYGYSREEFLSMTIGEIRPAEDVPRLVQCIAEHYGSPSHAAGTWRHRKKDGTIFFVDIMRHPLPHDGFRREMVFAVDVTGRVRAENEMAERSRLAVLVAESADALATAETLRGGLQICCEFLNRYIDAVFVRIWTMSDDLQTLELQASAGTLTTIDDEYARIPVGAMLIGKIAETQKPIVDNDALNSGWITDPERARNEHLAGFVGYPLMIDDCVVGVAAAFASHHLTVAAVQAFKSVARGMAQFIERKRSGERLNNLAALVECSNDAIVMATPEGRVTFINAAGARLLGFDGPGAVLGRALSEFHSAAGWEKANAEVMPACFGTGQWRGELQLRHTVTGEPIDVLMSAFLLHKENGEIISKAAVLHDIRDRKQAEEALRRAKESAESASRLKSEFLANMSHEIRTPMNGIIVMTDLALDTELTNEQREYLETVKASSDTLLTIINDILDFSRIEAGKLSLDQVEFDLDEAVEETVKLLRAGARQKGLTLDFEIQADVPRILRGDPVRVRQILFNLLGNAIKFTKTGGVTLRICVESERNATILLHFEVQDTGIGVPEDKQEIIFEAFTQADGTMSRKFGGTGLGLTICSRLVWMMQGRIWVDSAPGQGSTFHFTACFGRC